MDAFIKRLIFVFIAVIFCSKSGGMIITERRRCRHARILFYQNILFLSLFFLSPCRNAPHDCGAFLFFVVAY